MKKLLFFLSLIPTLVFGQQNIKQVLTTGNNAGNKSLVGVSLVGLNGSTSGTVTITPPAVVTTYTFTLPADDGTANQFLQTDGNGISSWATVSTGLTVGITTISSGADTRLLYQNGTVLGESGNMTYTSAGGLVIKNTSTNIPFEVDSASKYLFKIKTSGQILAQGDLYNLYVGGGSPNSNLAGGAVGNTMFGNAGGAITTGNSNCGFGSGALQSDMVGSSLTAFGYQALQHAVSDHSTAFGLQAGQALTTGINGCFFGSKAGAGVTTADNETAIGTDACDLCTAAGSTAVGSLCLWYCNGESAANTAVGYSAFGNIGFSGDHNTGIGVVVGDQLTTGSFNTFLGDRAAYSCKNASSYNTIVGATNIYTDRTETNCTALGFNAVISGDYTNATAIGYGAVAGASNVLVLGSGANVGIGTSTPTASLHITPPASTVAIKTSGRIEAAKGADVAAANDLTLGYDGNVFLITGNTTINAITTAGWQAGSEIILIFSGTPTVKDNTAGGAGTARIFLAASTDFAAAANSVLKLVLDGTQWQEVSRKVD